MKEKQRMVLLRAQGWSISAIAEELKIDRKTVRHYVRQEDFSEPFPQTPVRASNLDPFKPTIQAWLAEDARVRYKQRHTAERVHQRLQETFPETYTCSYSAVQRYIKQMRQERPRSETGTLELTWDPGVAPVDFGTADVYWQADDLTPQTVKYLTVSFPFSNAGIIQYFPGETAECVTQGLRDIFQWLGGVPPHLIFDNATGVGRRMGDVIRYAELFERFQAHYGFETTFCNPEAGYEKGNVEVNVGYLRRTLMVPPPVLGDWTTANQAAFAQCERLWHRPHYKKGLPIAELFDTDQQALRALPARPFRPIRFTRVRTDGYGKFRLDAQHWYSSAPEWARHELVVAIGALTVVPYTPDGTPITTHVRQYGETRTDTIDYRGIPGLFATVACAASCRRGL
jgi:transposase